MAVFDDVVADARARPLPQPTPRAVRLPLAAGKADAVVGMRRAGKTWLLFARVRALIEAGTPRADLLYLDFEDERLGDVSAADLGALVDAHYRANPGARGREGAFFFDEIQLVEGWARFVRRLLDAGSVRVCVTGSSATRLAREIATSLRSPSCVGRSVGEGRRRGVVLDAAP